jgi:anti-sigma B factor antagonist
MELKISKRVAGDVIILECAGRLVFGEEAALLRETVKALLPQNRKILLNLKNVSYIDSGGLGVLVGLSTSAQAAGGEIKLAELTQRVNQLLQVTKLVTVFDVRDTEKAGLDSFSSSAAVA